MNLALGLYLNRKNKNILFFGTIALLGIFLTKQVAPPFPDTYLWLFENFPGFNAFREASKFYLLIILGFSVLIAGFVDWIWKNLDDKGFQYYAKYASIIIIAGIFLWNTKPIITTEFGTLFVQREKPQEYAIFKDFVLKQDSYFRTLWLPTSSRWSIYTNNHPAVNTVSMINTNWSSFIKEKKN